MRPENAGMFEFLPLNIGTVQDFQVNLHLYTLPDSSLYKTVMSTLLKGVDGFVFIADSRVEKLEDNFEAMAGFRSTLIQEGVNPGSIPFVIQYNKTDLSQEPVIRGLREHLNSIGSKEIEAIATDSKGVMETLELISGEVLDQLVV